MKKLIKTILFAAIGFSIGTEKRWQIGCPNGHLLYGLPSRLCLYFKVFHWLQFCDHCFTFSSIDSHRMDYTALLTGKWNDTNL